MSYLNKEEMQHGGNAIETIKPGDNARVVLTSYEPFQFGAAKDKTMPKHLGYDNDSGTAYEFVGYAFHDAIKPINDVIVPGETVLEVQCLDNGTKYPDYAVAVSNAKAKPNPNAPIGADVKVDDVAATDAF